MEDSSSVSPKKKKYWVAFSNVQTWAWFVNIRSPLWIERVTSTEVTAPISHQWGLGSNPRGDNTCGWSLLLFPTLTPRGLTTGIMIFPSPQNPIFLNSDLSGMVDKESQCGRATSKLTVIYLFIYCMCYIEEQTWNFYSTSVWYSRGRSLQRRPRRGGKYNLLTELDSACSDSPWRKWMKN